MIVEGEGIGFWTRVRLPPSPLNRSKGEPGSRSAGFLDSTQSTKYVRKVISKH